MEFIVVVDGLVVQLGERIVWEMRRMGCCVLVRNTCRVAGVVRRDRALSDDTREEATIFAKMGLSYFGVVIITMFDVRSMFNVQYCTIENPELRTWSRWVHYVSGSGE